MGVKYRLADIPGPLPDAASLVALMGQDKKVRDGRLGFVLARDIGDAFVARDIDLDSVQSMLSGSLAARAG
jgi:3-dehydroquinate synthase